MLLFADSSILEFWPVRVVLEGLQETGFLLLYFVLPLILAAVVLHLLERLVQSRLMRRFGWRSVMFTGWLGTPIHELSHAALCLVFWHKIDELVLFRPDPATGRLGYVRHSYNPRNPFHVVGNFFIGMAPLAGGALVLFGLLWLFDGQAATAAFTERDVGDALARHDFSAATASFWLLAQSVLMRLLAVENLTNWPFWVFLYLVLCVGSHTAPSWSDYQGAWVGGLILLAALPVVNILIAALGFEPGWLAGAVAPWFGGLIAVFGLCAALCAVAAAVIVLFTIVWDATLGNLFR